LKQNLIKRPELLSHVLAKFGRKGWMSTCISNN
jgi:hypothetical protein